MVEGLCSNEFVFIGLLSAAIDAGVINANLLPLLIYSVSQKYVKYMREQHSMAINICKSNVAKHVSSGLDLSIYLLSDWSTPYL